MERECKAPTNIAGSLLSPLVPWKSLFFLSFSSTFLHSSEPPLPSVPISDSLFLASFLRTSLFASRSTSHTNLCMGTVTQLLTSVCGLSVNLVVKVSLACLTVITSSNGKHPSSSAPLWHPMAIALKSVNQAMKIIGTLFLVPLL